MEQKQDWKQKTLIIGGVVGLVAGVVAAMLLIQRAELEHSQPRITAGEGVKVGLGVLTVLRMIADLAARK